MGSYNVAIVAHMEALLEMKVYVENHDNSTLGKYHAGREGKNEN